MKRPFFKVAYSCHRAQPRDEQFPTTDEEAQKAVSMFNGQEFEGRKLTVNEARPMEARPPRTGGFGGGNGGYGGGDRGGRREY